MTSALPKARKKLEKPLGKLQKDFPFRDVLFIPEVNKYFGEFTKEEHERYNSRAVALQPIKHFLQNILRANPT